VQTYDYHPPIPIADPESPDHSLGNCAICMDAIRVDRPRRQTTSNDGIELMERGGKNMGGGLLDAVQKGVGAAVRRNYSLAPCHHLFVSDLL
jgi:hypothetical protein